MNNKMMATAVIMLVVGLGGGWLLSANFNKTNDTQTVADQSEKTVDRKPLFYRNPMDPTITSPTPAQDSMGMDYIPVYADKESGGKKVLFYRNPMNPDVTSPVPAKDSMGMDYVPVYADGGASSDIVGSVKIDPTIVQNIGVRTALARYGNISRTVRAVGRVDFNEETMTRLHPKVEGWIESIRIDKTGDSVKEDDILLSVYSPQLVSSQQEYLLALNNFEATKESTIPEIREGAQSLVNSARSRLTLLDVPEHQIMELEESREIQKSLHIHSPVAGTVIRIGARKGQHISPKTELYMIVDLSRVWVFADIYEYELPWVKSGDQVEMTLASVPGKKFTGTLEYVYPYAESKTRTTKVRMVFDNQERLLRPDMFADIRIKADTQNQAVIVPSEAVVRSGDSAQIFVMREPGKFEPRLVTLGIESKGEVSVIDGIKAGEKVVTSAQFLVDSESKLREATAKMLESMSSSDSKESDGSMDHSSMSDQQSMKHDGMGHDTMKTDQMKDHSKHKPAVKDIDQHTGHGEHNHD